MTGLALHPVDTLFFRDATPFHGQSAVQGEVGGLFPPNPPTVVGAVRAALARANGWDNGPRWPTSLDAVLGDGSDLGALSFQGPYLLDGDQVRFPVPRHLLGKSAELGWRATTALAPGPAVRCDLGEVRLPTMAPGHTVDPDLRPAGDCWLTRAGLEAALRGQLPAGDQHVASDRLWDDESRVGLEINRDRRAAEEGMLYSTRHARLRPGVALGVAVSGVPGDWASPAPGLVPLGGERRLAECRPWADDVTLEVAWDALRDSRRLLIVALTPLDLDPQAVARPGAILNAAGGAKLVSACLQQPARVGGWDSVEGRPLPQTSVVAAGSALFCELTDVEGLRQAVDPVTGLLRLGRRQAWGYGVAAIGTWPNND